MVSVSKPPKKSAKIPGVSIFGWLPYALPGVRSIARILNTGSGPLAPKPLQCEDQSVKVIAADGLARFYLKVCQNFCSFPVKMWLGSKFLKTKTIVPLDQSCILQISEGLSQRDSLNFRRFWGDDHFFSACVSDFSILS